MNPKKMWSFIEENGNCCILIVLFAIMIFSMFMFHRSSYQEANAAYNKFQTLTIPITGATLDAYDELYSVTVIDTQNDFKPHREKIATSLVPENLRVYPVDRKTRIHFTLDKKEQKLIINKSKNPLELYYDVYLMKENPPSYY